MEKINIAEILKDCPKGMELDCSMFENPVQYIGLTESGTYAITIKTSCGNVCYLTKEGYLYNMADSKCIIFPKGKTTWEGFVPPVEFKDGDILCNSKTKRPFILKFFDLLNNNVHSYCGIDGSNKFYTSSNNWAYASDVRIATEEEKAKLFQAIKDNGYRWNAETKTLDMETNKFNITTLKPFDKILVRDTDNAMWIAALFSHLREMRFYTVSTWYNQCVPYEGNQHLLGTTNDCDEFYKTW